MKNYFLKFVDQADLENTLVSAGISTMEPIFGTDRLVPNAAIALDIIGLIYKPTGVILTTEDGMKYPEMLPLEGWHANLKAALTPEQETALPLIATPNAPYRKWAGE